jgi:hypothetical protein
MKTEELRSVSVILWGLERVFRFLETLSLLTYIVGSRTKRHEKLQFIQSKADIEALTKTQSLKVEYYLIAWLIVEVLCVVLLTAKPIDAVQVIVVVIAAYRLLDILQAVMNLNVFQRLRLPSSDDLLVVALARIVILSVWNFIELMILFGLIYASNLALLNPASTIFGALYFSVVTQLTIGYGDVAPHGVLRLVTMIQGILGFLVAVFAVSRVIAFLPKPKAVKRDD